jgi:Asp-tRNA(Asn)/Glu-tRNA(Gln) amidotransferase A subunit family amidase
MTVRRSSRPRSARPAAGPAAGPTGTGPSDHAAQGQPVPSRRRFLAAASASLAAGAAAKLGAQGRMSTPPVDESTLACAEDLTGLAFSPGEQALMVRAVRENRDHFEALRSVPVGPDVEPALTFHVPDPSRERQARRPRVAGVHIEVEAPSDTSPEYLTFAPAIELAALLRAGRVTSLQLTRLALDRLERADASLHCVVTLTRDLALEQARRADEDIAAGRYRGPLHGLPYGLKDLVATRGIRTTWGAKPYEHQVIDTDATVYERLREAGAVLVAKLTSGELAVGDVWFGGRTRNPWDPNLGSGGSSAGPAAATAAGLVPFAIGTETNGSIITPSSMCGVTGLRPTYGRVSRHGVMALRWTLDKVGVLARTAADTALVLDVIHGPDGRDETAADAAFEWTPSPTLAGLRIGIVESEVLAVSPLAGAARLGGSSDAILRVRSALDVLRAAGAEVVPVSLPDFPTRAMYAVCNAEAGAAFDELVRSGAVDRLSDQGANGRANQLRWSRFIPAVEYLRAQRVRTLLIRQMAAVFDRVDALAAPAESDSITMTNFTGHPALTLSCGFSQGLPVGLMVSGRHYDEATLLRIGHAYQALTVWHRQRPPLFATL